MLLLAQPSHLATALYSCIHSCLCGETVPGVAMTDHVAILRWDVLAG
jgi:hypothetical protein|eukprot:SAG25_NODE_1176_length_3692_cov_2.811578_8_plen_47_part_00